MSRIASIRKVVDLYIDGVQNGNLDSMRQAFHPQSSMFGYKGKDLFITPIQGLYDYIAGTTPPAQAGAVGKAYTCSITSISVVGNAASVGNGNGWLSRA
ncbi:MAG: nuclear transport factor 2 family protein [Caldilineaceae bacterium]